MMDDLKEARERSEEAVTQFRQKVAELHNSLEFLPKLAVMEIANGSAVITRTNMFNYVKVDPSMIERFLEAKPDVILVDGDDPNAMEALSKLNGMKASRLAIMKHESLCKMTPSIESIKHVVFRPVIEDELVDIIDCLRLEK